MHILLIVDDTATRNTFQKLFEASGHKITAVGIADVGGLKMPKTLDSALIDLNVEKLPEGDVKSALAGIASSVPTLLLYGNHPNDVEVKAYEIGACELMHKKCDIKTLIEKIESFKMTKLKAA